jgi:hypothetical protein
MRHKFCYFSFGDDSGQGANSIQPGAKAGRCIRPAFSDRVKSMEIYPLFSANLMTTGLLLVQL